MNASSLLVQYQDMIIRIPIKVAAMKEKIIIQGDASYSEFLEFRVTKSTPNKLIKVPKTCRHVMFSLNRQREATNAYKQFTFRIAEHKLKFKLFVKAS